MKNDVTVMTDVFKNAMIFEKYKKLWLDSISYVNGLLEDNNDKTKRALHGIQQEKLVITGAEDKNNEYLMSAKKDIKKYKKIITVLLSVIGTLIFAAVAAYSLKLMKAFMVLIAILCQFAGMGTVIVVGILIYCFYNIHKRKKDIDNFKPEKAVEQKKIAENNIKVYDSFLQKTKSEKNYLLSKKQALVTELNKANDTLRQIYSYDLIPETFRGLVPTATIYGYLYNGICTAICGHGGVYERYVNDLQHGEIVGYLNSISKKLDIVIKNQNELKKTLDSIDLTLSGIKREIEYGNRVLSDIRTNTAITAAATQQSAAHEEYIATAVWRSL